MDLSVLHALAKEYLLPFFSGAKLVDEPARSSSREECVALVDPCTIAFKLQRVDNYRLLLWRSQPFAKLRTQRVTEKHVVEAFASVVREIEPGLSTTYRSEGGLFNLLFLLARIWIGSRGRQYRWNNAVMLWKGDYRPPFVQSVYLVGKYSLKSDPRDVDLFVVPDEAFISRLRGGYGFLEGFASQLLVESIRDCWWVDYLNRCAKSSDIGGFHVNWKRNDQMEIFRLCTTNSRELRSKNKTLFNNDRNSMAFRACFDRSDPNLWISTETGTISFPNPFFVRKTARWAKEVEERSRNYSTSPKRDGHRLLVAIFLRKVFPRLQFASEATPEARMLFYKEACAENKNPFASTDDRYVKSVGLLLLQRMTEDVWEAPSTSWRQQLQAPFKSFDNAPALLHNREMNARLKWRVYRIMSFVIVCQVIALVIFVKLGLGLLYIFQGYDILFLTTPPLNVGLVGCFLALLVAFVLNSVFENWMSKAEARLFLWHYLKAETESENVQGQTKNS